MNKLQKLAAQLDETRFRLLINEQAYDDELKETWGDFIAEVVKLNEQIAKVTKGFVTIPFNHCPDCGCSEMLCGHKGCEDTCTSNED